MRTHVSERGHILSLRQPALRPTPLSCQLAVQTISSKWEVRGNVGQRHRAPVHGAGHDLLPPLIVPPPGVLRLLLACTGDVALAQGAGTIEGQPPVDAGRVEAVLAGQHAELVPLLEDVATYAADILVVAARLAGLVQHRGGRALDGRFGRAAGHPQVLDGVVDPSVDRGPRLLAQEEGEDRGQEERQLQAKLPSSCQAQLPRLLNRSLLEVGDHAEAADGVLAAHAVVDDEARVDEPPDHGQRDQARGLQERERADHELQEAQVAMASTSSKASGNIEGTAKTQVDAVQAEDGAGWNHLEDDEDALGDPRRLVASRSRGWSASGVLGSGLAQRHRVPRPPMMIGSVKVWKVHVHGKSHHAFR
mmetsp:Transcript_75040/g.219846  ORF Transcript_75040/g.219846 Transcript_75040/m.219846 type:complete len:363 (+) Transcript_75040:26-1114(+)